MSRISRRFLICAGLLFFAIEGYRLYMLYTRTMDRLLSQHYLLALLAIVCSLPVVMIGLKGSGITKKDALTLIRSGSVLMAIWAYRVYLIYRTVKTPLIRKGLAYTGITYILLSLLIIVAGFKIKKDLGLRQDELV